MSLNAGSSLRVVLVAITANFFVTVAKFIGWFFSQSPSMLAEAIHSLADTINQGLLYVGIKAGTSTPSREYPWGKGQARYLWNLVSATGIFFLGFGFTTYHGIENLIDPSDKFSPNFIYWAIGILVFSLILESYSWLVAYRAVREDKKEQTLFEYILKGDDPTSVGVFLEDSVAVIGVLVAITGISISHFTGNPIPDAVGSIIIGFLLGVMALVLAIANGRLLIGAAIDPERESKIREFIDQFPTVEKVTSFKSEVLSPGRVRLSLEVEFHGSVIVNRAQIERDVEKLRDGEEPGPILYDTAERTVRLVGREINRLEAAIQAQFPDVVAIDLEVN
jgi:zinc transporter 9